MEESKERILLRNLILAAVFTALAFGSEFLIHFKVSFLSYDAKDAILTIGSLFYGPLLGLFSALITAFFEMLTVSTTGIWGFLMNFVSTATFICVASLIYKKVHTLKGAILGLSASVISMTLIMMPMNLIITPIYTGTNVETVLKMIPKLLLPFNFTKALLNASITLLLYKPVFTALRSAKIIKTGEKMTFDKKTIIIMVTGAILSLSSVLVMIFVIR